MVIGSTRDNDWTSCKGSIRCFCSIKDSSLTRGSCSTRVIVSTIYDVWLGNNGVSGGTVFLAHLSQRLKWAIVIAHCPSSVRPSSSVRRPSVVRPSVNFHIFNFFSRTAWWILMKLGRDEVLMVPYKCCCFSARSAQGRIQGGAKIGQRGSPSSRNFFFRPEGYSDKPNG